MDAQAAAVALARGRSAIGIVALAAPRLASRAALGPAGAAGGAPVFARMLGARDVALGLGAVIALDRGAPVRGWLEAGALVDGVDLVTALLAREQIPRAALVSTVVLAGGAALGGIVLARLLDPAPPATPGHPEALATGHPPANGTDATASAS
jgi:hypothetical protein